ASGSRSGASVGVVTGSRASPSYLHPQAGRTGGLAVPQCALAIHVQLAYLMRAGRGRAGRVARSQTDGRLAAEELATVLAPPKAEDALALVAEAGHGCAAVRVGLHTAIWAGGAHGNLPTRRIDADGRRAGGFDAGRAARVDTD